MARKPAKPKTNKQVKLEVGDSGTRILNGIINEEYNSKLYAERGIAVYDEMRKSDGTVRAAVLVVTLPIRAAHWFVKPASEDAADVAIAEHVRQCLFEKLNFDDFLRQALLCLPFGVMPFEKVYGTDTIDGKEAIVWKKLSPRLPRSIQKWAIADDKFGITQNTATGKVVEIPGEKLIIFVNEMEGENWWGTSILRAAYKHWYIKNSLYKIDAIAFERQGLGVPEVVLPENYTEADRSKAEAISKNLRANEHAYVVRPDNYTIGFMDMKATGTRDPHNSLAHHNREIMKSVLAQFLELGASAGGGTSGSRALSEDHSELFLQSVEAVAKNIASAFNQQAIKELVDLNFDGVEKYPTLDFEGITPIDAKAIAESYKTLIDTGGMTPQDEDEEFFRNTLGLPEFDPAGKRERPVARTTPPAPDEENDDAAHDMAEHLHVKKKPLAFSEFRPSRKLTFAEQKVNFQGLQDKLNELETQFDAETGKLLHEARDRFMTAFTRAAHAGDTEALRTITLKAQDEFRSIIKSAMQVAFNHGKNTAAKEMGLNAPANPATMLQQISIQAAAIADQQIAEITSEAKNAYVQALNKGSSTAQALGAADAAMAAAIDRLTSDTSSILMAGYVNHGRNVVFDRMSDSVYALQRSELLDLTTCNYCLSVDGRIIEKDDPFGQNTIFHSHCRGIWVGIKTDEDELPKIGGIPKALRDRFGDVVNDLIQPRTPITKKGTPARAEADKRNAT